MNINGLQADLQFIATAASLERYGPLSLFLGFCISI
jgi:hypothetical protein